MASSTTVRDERLLIGGDWVEAASGRRFDVTDPATGEVVGSVPDADAGDVRRAVDAAEAALPGWRATPAVERARILRRAADLMLDRAGEIGALMTAEQGKPLAEAKGEVAYAAGFLEWFSGEAERIYGQVVPSTKADKRILVLRQPVGVTAALTPWNFPAAMLTRKLGPALAAGCTSVAKPAELTPLTAVEVCRALIDAGLPAGVVNLVTTETPATVSTTLLADARVRKLSFTGSTPVGKELMRLAADNLARLSLELGGHAPFIIFDDADLPTAVDSLIASKFRNAGQTCVCANRVYVQRGVYDEVLERVAAAVTALQVGRGTEPGVTIGPLIHERAVRKVEAHVDDAVRHGARVVVGGDRLTAGDLAAGHYYAPTLLGDITPEMLISREETFGPVAGLQPFDSEEEAIALANDTVYGLAAYFHTRDYARLLRVAERLEYGIVGANDGVPSTPNAPFGGVKESGFGREGGSVGIDEYLEVKYVSIGGVGS
ncbi:MAG: Succinate-semialdehyde dehydrogenase [NAD(P)+], partial [uncultured Thermoleophilia bacterium]